MITFNNNEKETIKYSISENIEDKQLVSVDIPFGIGLIDRLDNHLSVEDINIINFCTKYSYAQASKQQFSNDYVYTLYEIRNKILQYTNE